jgi:hypothetical protein
MKMPANPALLTGAKGSVPLRSTTPFAPVSLYDHNDKIYFVLK